MANSLASALQGTIAVHTCMQACENSHAADQYRKRKEKPRSSLSSSFLFPFLLFYCSSVALVFSSCTAFFCTCMLIRRSLQGSCLSSILLFICKGYPYPIYSLSWRRFSRREEAGPPSNSLTYTLGNPRSRISRSSYNSPVQHLLPFLFGPSSPPDSLRHLVHVCCRESHQGLRVTVNALSYTDSTHPILLELHPAYPL